MDDRRVLEALGIDEADEAVYQALIDGTALTAAEIVAVSSRSEANVQKALRSLETMGLVARTVSKPARFTAAPPGVALEGLILNRQSRLDEARIAVKLLEERYRKSERRTNISDVVEVVVGEEAIAQRFAQLQRGARAEILGLARPPHIVPADTNPAEIEMLNVGVRYCGIYDSETLEWPGMLDGILGFAEAGEEVRTHSNVPMKLIIVDRKMALVPLAHEPDGRIEGALVVYASYLLDGLCSLWDAYWEQAVPLQPGSKSTIRSAALSKLDEQLVVLLGAGLKPAAIARQLGIGESTVARRTKNIMEKLGARTNIQLGIQLAKRGLIELQRSE